MRGMKFSFLCKKKPQPTGKRVAIVGAGPAGLTAAGYLVCRGHDVDIYDKMPEPGGLMLFVIPEFRIPVERVRLGAKELADEFEVTYYPRTKVMEGERLDEGDEFYERVIRLSELKENYDTVLIATGIWNVRRIGIPGDDLEGILSPLELLFWIKGHELGYVPEEKVPELKGKKVGIIGAGLTAVDVAFECSRLGADVEIFYRRTIREAPAGAYEINILRNRGVKWFELVTPKSVIGENGRVKAIELLRTRLGEPDETGRRRPIPIPGSEFQVPVDYLVFAIGMVSTPPVNGSYLAVDRRGRLVVDSRHMTSVEGIFAAGDVANGPTKVGRAIKDGLYTAVAIDKWLRGES
ncbi:FAD-dependent oxidoreductase [Thermococcus sp.]|uniref:FAD-dependent oxidoreductase n=1 Tax=Thermococcus sp. TaxID=35749 RepID=UPI0026319F4C|nr:FAD-dependent oxidoreductase [Thermococcus sp.]